MLLACVQTRGMQKTPTVASCMQQINTLNKLHEKQVQFIVKDHIKQNNEYDCIVKNPEESFDKYDAMLLKGETSNDHYFGLFQKFVQDKKDLINKMKNKNEDLHEDLDQNLKDFQGKNAQHLKNQMLLSCIGKESKNKAALSKAWLDYVRKDGFSVQKIDPKIEEDIENLQNDLILNLFNNPEIEKEIKNTLKSDVQAQESLKTRALKQVQKVLGKVQDYLQPPVIKINAIDELQIAKELLIIFRDIEHKIQEEKQKDMQEFKTETMSGEEWRVQIDDSKDQKSPKK